MAEAHWSVAKTQCEDLDLRISKKSDYDITHLLLLELA